MYRPKPRRLCLPIQAQRDQFVGSEFFELSLRLAPIRTRIGNQLGTYEPERVCATNDGNIWTLGQDWGAESYGESYPILRQYSSAGEALGSYFSRTSLRVEYFGLSTHARAEGAHPPQDFTGGRTHLRCGRVSVGVYIGPARTWFEVRLADGSTQSWRVEPPFVPSNMTGISFTGADQLYASFTRAIPAGNSAEPPAHQYGLYVLDVAGQTAVWDPVPGSIGSTGRPFGRLVGGGTQSLVYMGKGGISPNGTVALSWTAR